MSTTERPQRAPVTIPRERGRRRIKMQFREYEDIVTTIRQLAELYFPQADGTGNDAAMCRHLIKAGLKSEARRRAAKRPLFSESDTDD